MNYKLSDDRTTLLGIHKDVETLDIPESVTKIKCIISARHNIKSINGPNVIKIDEKTFQYSNIECVNLPVIKSIDRFTFYNCFNLKYIHIPNLEIIDVNAFSNCSNIESIILPKLTTIEYGAFYFCYKLKYIDAPLLSKLGNNIFCSCYNLQYFNSKLNMDQLKSSFYVEEQFNAYKQRNRDYKLSQLNILENELY